MLFAYAGRSADGFRLLLGRGLGLSLSHTHTHSWYRRRQAKSCSRFEISAVPTIGSRIKTYDVRDLKLLVSLSDEPIGHLD